MKSRCYSFVKFWTLEIFTMETRDIQASSGLPCHNVPSSLSLSQCHTSSLVHSDHQSASGIVSSIIIISGMTRTTVDILRLELLHRGFSITHPLIQAWVHIAYSSENICGIKVDLCLNLVYLNHKLGSK